MLVQFSTNLNGIQGDKTDLAVGLQLFAFACGVVGESGWSSYQVSKRQFYDLYRLCAATDFEEPLESSVREPVSQCSE